MSRWAPDARERLTEAAWQLFAENGYDDTTVAQIAERAGLNRATFFRHFTDKREILFGGEDRLGTVFLDAIRAAPPEASAVDCLRAALLAADAVMAGQGRQKVALRRRVAETSTEVQERGLAKNARIAGEVARALGDRGVDEATSKLAAHVLLLAFAAATHDWLEADSDDDFASHAVRALTALRAGALRLANESAGA